MTCATPLSITLSWWLAGMCLVAGGLAAPEKTRSEAGSKPAAEALAPPAPSKDLVQRGGAWFLFKASPAEGGKATTEAMESIGDSISHRLDPNGKLNVKVAPHGENVLYIEVPGLDAKSADAAKPIIETQGKLAFHLLGPDGLDGFTDAEDDALKPGLVKLRYLPEANDKSRKWLWVEFQTNLTGKMVRSATPDLQPGSGSFVLDAQLHLDAGEKMRELTKANLGKPLAIVVDGEIVSAPTIQAEFGAHFQISGQFTEAEAVALASQLANPLNHPVTLLNSGTIPPATGQKP